MARAGCGVYGSYGVVCRHEPGGGARWGLERSPCRVSPFACGRVCGACPPRAPGPASQTHVTLATTNNAYIRYGIECTKTERIFDSSPFFHFYYLLLFDLIYDKVILRLCVVLVGCGAGGRGGAPAAGARPRRARAERESGNPTRAIKFKQAVTYSSNSATIHYNREPRVQSRECPQSHTLWSPRVWSVVTRRRENGSRLSYTRVRAGGMAGGNVDGGGGNQLGVANVRGSV